MIFADIDRNAILIVVIMVIAGLKWLIERMKGEHLQPRDGSESTNTFQDLYEEARREIQQRQGGIRPDPEPRSVIFEPLATPPPLPPTSRKAKPAAEFSPYGPKKQKEARSVLTPAQKAAAQRMESRGISLHGRRRKPRREGTGVRALLASPSAARDAIVLREILGPPKGSA